MSAELSVMERSQAIKAMAMELGFELVGFAKAEYMEDEAVHLKEWLGLEYHGSMAYMENHFGKRVDPRKLVLGAQSVISLGYNYHSNETLNVEQSPKISSYAYGRDYHKVIKKKLKTLASRINEIYGAFEHRSFVDSAPVLERDWAFRAGLGWVGKNTLLINPKKGSKFFLAEMIVDFELKYDNSIADYCGTCTKCIDACPTDAILEEGYVLDASKCISYLTIELKDDDLPEEYKGKMENWMYGCDICQDVCPWNRFAQQHYEEDFLPKPELMEMTKEDWNGLTEEKFNELFQGSAVKRAGYKGLMRNIGFLNLDSN